MRSGTPQHTLYPAKGPVLPRGPGRSPGRKFWPLQRHFNAENHVTMTYSTLLESSRRDLRDSGHTRGCEMGQKDGPGRAGTGRAGARARAAAHAGRAGGAHLGHEGWTGMSPSSPHGVQQRRARARRTPAQLQASHTLSAGQEPCPPLEQRAPWPSEKSQRLRREGRAVSLSGAHAGMQRGQRAIGL